jgi:hypothetical protein
VSHTESEAKVPWNETDRRAESRTGDSRRSRKVIGSAKGRANRDAGTTQWRPVETPAAILLPSNNPVIACCPCRLPVLRSRRQSKDFRLSWTGVQARPVACGLFDTGGKHMVETGLDAARGFSDGEV